jgi:hypothetical protein
MEFLSFVHKIAGSCDHSLSFHCGVSATYFPEPRFDPEHCLPAHSFHWGSSTMAVQCPVEGCTRDFDSFKALSSHMKHCKFLPEALAATAKHYADIDRPRKRQKTSLSTAADDEEQDDAGSIDFEVSHDIFAYFQFLRVHEQPQVEEPHQPSPLLPEDPIDDLSEVPGPSSSRPRRNTQLPLRFQDAGLNSYLPGYMSQRQQREAAAAEEATEQVDFSTPTPSPHSATPVELQTIQTESDEFGRYRIYQRLPDHEPGNFPQPDHNDFTAETHQGNPGDLASGLCMPIASLSDLPGLVGLFINATVALLVQWFYSGTSTKSLTDVQHLIDDVILHEDFQAEDLQGVNFAKEVKKMDTFESSLEGKGWTSSSVKIKVPCPGYKQDEAKAKEFEVPGVLHRDLIDIIKSACQDPDTLESFHTTPFVEMWKPSEDAEPIRLYGRPIPLTG